VHGPGDVQGQRIELDDERVRFLLKAYRLDDRGRRMVRRGVLSRAKGWAKSEFAAMIAAVEALGPARFAGWDHDGRPMGRPVQAPYIPCIATEEGQAGNTYSAIEYMLRHGAISRLSMMGLDVGLTRTFVPGGGKIQALSARATSKEGGKETFANFDETHLYVTRELRDLHSTVRRNLGKRKIAEPWSLETTTMYAPGEGSVSESSHKYAEAIAAGTINDPGFLFDHLQGSLVGDWDDDDELRDALVEAYGEAADWMDLERLIAEARDPDTEPSDFKRFFLNQPTERTTGKWITDERWRECAALKTRIPKNVIAAVGVDAALTRDTTARAVAFKKRDGTIHVTTRVWTTIERRVTALPQLAHVYIPNRIDNDIVRDEISDDVAGRYTVRLLFYDKRFFDTQANDLARDGLTVVGLEPQDTPAQDAWDLFYKLVHQGPKPGISHDGDPVFAAHVSNCVGTKTTRGWKVAKVKADKPIDAVAAAVYAVFGVEFLDEYVETKRSWRAL